MDLPWPSLVSQTQESLRFSTVCLIGDRAIVTAVPGTTRDLISERVSIGGVPIELVDTAGLRATTDEIEALGIAKSREALASADLVLFITEAHRDLSKEEVALLKTLAEQSFAVVRNKLDLRTETFDSAALGNEPALTSAVFDVATSARTGEGIDLLRSAIKSHMGGNTSVETGLLTNARQYEAVLRSLEESSRPVELLM